MIESLNDLKSINQQERVCMIDIIVDMTLAFVVLQHILQQLFQFL